MGALVSFGPDGQRLESWGCDARIAQELARCGAAWGRWPLRTEPDAPIDQLRSAYRDDLLSLHPVAAGWQVECLDLVNDAAAGLAPDQFRRRDTASAPAELLYFLEGAGLLYLHLGDRYLGLLCDAGEWVRWPAGLPQRLDVGEQPQVRALHCLAAPTPMAAVSEAVAAVSLPRFEDFVEQVLAWDGDEELA